jgi:hypothetical protein
VIVDEVIARLEQLAARLERLEQYAETVHEQCEVASRRRVDELARLEHRVNDGLQDMRYELDRV